METDNDILVVQKEEVGVRLDRFLTLRFPDYSRTYFQSLIDQKLVLVNNELIKKGRKLEEGDEVEVEFAITSEINVKAEPIPLEIIYEDDHILAANKPVGMVVHPAVGNWSGTFVNALLYHCCQLPGQDTLRPGIVHRLDKETSGILLAAKDEQSQRKLVECFAERKIQKTYLAICLGNPGQREIVGNIGRHPTKRKEMTVLQEGGKKAVTYCETLAYNATLSLVRLSPFTGRTHQLRVHMQSIGFPILGDTLYGSSRANTQYQIFRQLLHAYSLKFHHPITQEMVELKAPLPQDILEYIKQISPYARFDTES